MKKSIVKNLASFFSFWTVRCSYDETLPYLEFIETKNNMIPIRYYNRDNKLPTMIICAGCYEDIGWFDPVELSKEYNSNIIQFDYSGYGMNTREVSSEEYCYEDVIGVYDYLLNIKNINHDNIIIYGRSLGTGVATYLAYYISENYELLPKGLILISPFESILKCYINITLKGDIFKNRKIAPKVKIPTLIIHGNNDWVVIYRNSVKLSQLFSNLYKFITIDNKGHGDIRNDQYYNSIHEFISNDKKQDTK